MRRGLTAAIPVRGAGKRMELELQVLRGPTRIKSVRIEAAAAIIGRGKGCKVRIPSAEVSRRHCLLFVDQGCLGVEDLKSANGTYLNGARIIGRHLVRPGDQLGIGPLTLIAHYQASPEALSRLTMALAGDEAIEVLEGELLADDDSTAAVGLEAMTEAEALEAVLLDEDMAIPADMDQWKLSDPTDLRNILSEIDKPNSR